MYQAWRRPGRYARPGGTVSMGRMEVDASGVLQQRAMLIRLSAEQMPRFTHTAMGGKRMATRPRKISLPHMVGVKFRSRRVRWCERSKREQNRNVAARHIIEIERPKCPFDTFDVFPQNHLHSTRPPSTPSHRSFQPQSPPDDTHQIRAIRDAGKERLYSGCKREGPSAAFRDCVTGRDYRGALAESWM